MLEILQKGGPLMWIILLCSMVALGVFLIAGGPGIWRNAHDAQQRARTRHGGGAQGPQGGGGEALAG